MSTSKSGLSGLPVFESRHREPKQLSTKDGTAPQTLETWFRADSTFTAGLTAGPSQQVY